LPSLVDQPPEGKHWSKSNTMATAAKPYLSEGKRVCSLGMDTIGLSAIHPSFARLPDTPGTYRDSQSFVSMTIWNRPHSKTIWNRPHSNVPALRLGSIELRELLSRELDKANVVLDEWDFARTWDKQSGASQRSASNEFSAAPPLRGTVQ
jgi:hypothetical protein